MKKVQPAVSSPTFGLVSTGRNIPFTFPDETLCVVDSDKGCSQFCKPGYTSYVCSCAQGWKISSSDRTKCVPTGMYFLPECVRACVCQSTSIISERDVLPKGRFPCGKVNTVGQWENRMTSNKQSNFEGVSCTSGECPWQVRGSDTATADTR